MADYHTPTVVTPYLPSEAISLLELLVLTQMYDWEHSGDEIYFFSEVGCPFEIELEVAEVRDLIEAAPADAGRLVDLIRAQSGGLKPEQTTFKLDVSDCLNAGIFQDILGRCPDIDHITITFGWTYSKMRSDGFGGAVTVITSDQILTETTRSMERLLLGQACHGEIGVPPGSGVHRVLTLSEQTVRKRQADVEQLALDRGEKPVALTDGDIRDGCREAVAALDLEALAADLTPRAAEAAMRIARHQAD
ncbi:MAG: hypothetical protein KGJ57_18410 [Sphingomonadales bacterium]|nr:hypothetical protein [Sphingomonadales bacterium]MDE2171373.1 hypothetical protein [Sphingomonadales bacterium]